MLGETGNGYMRTPYVQLCCKVKMNPKYKYIFKANQFNLLAYVRQFSARHIINAK